MLQLIDLDFDSELQPHSASKGPDPLQPAPNGVLGPALHTPASALANP